MKRDPSQGDISVSRTATDMVMECPIIVQAIAPCDVPAVTSMDSTALMQGKLPIKYGT